MKFVLFFLIIIFLSFVNSSVATDNHEIVWGFSEKFEAAHIPPTMAGRYLSIVSVNDLLLEIGEGNEKAPPLAKELGSIIKDGRGAEIFHPSQLDAIKTLLAPYTN